MKPIGIEFLKWQKWAQLIKDDIQNRLVNPRQVYREFAATVNANVEHIGKHDGGVFCRFVQRCYASHAATAIRSHVKWKEDRKDDSVSVTRLLCEIRNCASQFTFQFYLQQFPINPSYVDWQTVTFSLFSENGAAVSPQLVQKDVDDLKHLTGKVESLVDRSLAHLDKRGVDAPVTLGDLDVCIDAFDRLVCKYLKLINGGGYATLEPTILCDWRKIFTVPFDIRAAEMFAPRPPFPAVQ